MSPSAIPVFSDHYVRLPSKRQLMTKAWLFDNAPSNYDKLNVEFKDNKNYLPHYMSLIGNTKRGLSHPRRSRDICASGITLGESTERSLSRDRVRSERPPGMSRAGLIMWPAT